MTNKVLLVADVGGTKTNLALYTTEKGPNEPLHTGSLPSTNYNDFESLVNDYLAENKNIRVQAASIGVAGPIVGNKATLTNLHWEIDGNKLKKKIGVESLWLMNDLVATARAVPYLDTQDLYSVFPGKEEPGGTKAVIAPGTGLGVAYLVWDGKGYNAYASEGGHVDFAPTDQLQAGLLTYLQDRFGHVSYERVCSGKGLPNIYDYLKSIEYEKETIEITEALRAASDPAPLIVNNGLRKTGGCKLCRKTLEIFVSILGAVAGNLALNLMATGGAYLGGGIPPRIIESIDSENFRKAFLKKGRMTPILERIPVRIILNPQAALLGAAAYGLERGEV